MLGKVPVLDVLLLFEAGCLADGTPAEATALGLGFKFRGFGLRVCGKFRCTEPQVSRLSSIRTCRAAEPHAFGV